MKCLVNKRYITEVVSKLIEAIRLFTLDAMVTVTYCIPDALCVHELFIFTQCMVEC